MDLPGGGGAGVCASPINLPREGAEGMQGGGCKFFSSVEKNIICEERFPGHGFQVIERVLGHLFHSPKLIFYCFQRRNFWKGLAVWEVAHPLPKIYGDFIGQFWITGRAKRIGKPKYKGQEDSENIISGNLRL